MNKEFVPYEQALSLKELEFDELCICIYNREKALRANVFNNSNDRFKSVQLSYNNGKIPAPLYQQAFRWFREKYGLIGYIQTSYITHEVVNNRNIPCTPRIEFTFGITNTIGKSIFSSFKQGSFKTYEEAELEGLKKLIENFKQK